MILLKNTIKDNLHYQVKVSSAAPPRVRRHHCGGFAQSIEKPAIDDASANDVPVAAQLSERQRPGRIPYMEHHTISADLVSLSSIRGNFVAASTAANPFPTGFVTLLLQADCEEPYPHLLRRLLRHTKVGHPQLIRSVSPNLAIHSIQRTGCGSIANRRTQHFASYDGTQAVPMHQPLHVTASKDDLFPTQLVPYLFSTVDLEIGMPHTMNVGPQSVITLRAFAAELRVVALRSVTRIVQWSDLQHSEKRLGSGDSAMLVNESHQDLKRRSSSTRPKKHSQDAEFRWPCEAH